jgi:dual specificity MAP kinase phosphatase
MASVDPCLKAGEDIMSSSAAAGPAPEDAGLREMERSVVKSRPRAKTSPWLSTSFGGDHQTWFNDPRFDGSFPSRVLPFLYLGNLYVSLSKLP